MESPLPSPLLQHRRGRPPTARTPGCAAHYGDPYAEQRALAPVGLVDRPTAACPDHRCGPAVLAAQPHHPGPRAARARATAEALILSPNGHVEHHLTLADDGTALWAHVEPGTAGGLLAFLESMRFMLRVEPADVTGQFAVLTLKGPGAGGDLAGKRRQRCAAVRYGSDRHQGRLAAAASRPAGSAGCLAGMWAFEALRIAAHQPRFGLDTDHRTIPHEVGWIATAVHLNKGCYRGQETVARVHNLGHPPRRLVLLHLDGSADRLPGHGDPVSGRCGGGLRRVCGAPLRTRAHRARARQADHPGDRATARRAASPPRRRSWSRRTRGQT